MNTETKLKYPRSELGATVAIREAKAQFSALVERAAAGEEIVITGVTGRTIATKWCPDVKR